MTRFISGVPRLSARRACVCVGIVFSHSCTLQPGGLRNLTGGGAGRRGPVPGQAQTALHPPSAFYSSSFGHARVCDRILPESSEKTGNSSPSATNQSTTKQALLWEGPGPSGGVASVEEDGVGVPVGDLSHVLQDVLLGDDPQQPPVHAGREKTHLIGWRCFQAQ